MSTARNHLAELTDLMESTAEMLIETRHAASVRDAHMCAAYDRAELKQFINDSAVSAADNTTTGTKPCK